MRTSSRLEIRVLNDSPGTISKIHCGVRKVVDIAAASLCVTWAISVRSARTVTRFSVHGTRMMVDYTDPVVDFVVR